MIALESSAPAPGPAGIADPSPATPVKSTDPAPRRPRADVWRDPPRVVVTTPRMDNRDDWRSEPLSTLAAFDARVREGIPGVPHALCLKAPGDGSGPGNWEDQWGILRPEQRHALMTFLEIRRGAGRDTILNTCPPEPVVPMLTRWSNWPYVLYRCGFLLDSTASRIYLAQELQRKIASHTRGQIATGELPQGATALRIGIEGWGESAWSGFAVMNWRKVVDRAADPAWLRIHERHARRRYLLTRDADARGGGEIPLVVARAWIDRGYGLWALNPSAELKALIVEAFAEPAKP